MQTFSLHRRACGSLNTACLQVSLRIYGLLTIDNVDVSNNFQTPPDSPNNFLAVELKCQIRSYGSCFLPTALCK
jgi:hypothetical protein